MSGTTGDRPLSREDIRQIKEYLREVGATPSARASRWMAEMARPMPPAETRFTGAE